MNIPYEKETIGVADKESEEDMENKNKTHCKSHQNSYRTTLLIFGIDCAILAYDIIILVNIANI